MNILSYLQDNIEFFEAKVAKAKAEQSTTQDMWDQCLRAAQKRLERHLEENRDSE